MVRIASCGGRWDQIGVIRPDDWQAARQAVARGASVVSLGGRSLVWLDEPCALAPAQGELDKRLGLRIRAYTLVSLDSNDQLVKTFPLGGATVPEVSTWATKHGVSARAESGLPEAPAPEVLVHIERLSSFRRRRCRHERRGRPGGGCRALLPRIARASVRASSTAMAVS